MPLFIAKVMLQDVTDENIYQELDNAMAKEEGYTYITDSNDKIFALPPDEFEFDVDMTADELLNAVKLICAQLEKKHNLKKSPIIIVEVENIKFANLEELQDSDFDDHEIN